MKLSARYGVLTIGGGSVIQIHSSKRKDELLQTKAKSSFDFDSISILFSILITIRVFKFKL